MSVKQDILYALVQSGDIVSGQILAKKLGITRSSVWKSINQLRKDGFVIQASTNQGYRILEDGNRISEPFIRTQIQNNKNYSFHIYDTLISTNTTAKELAAAGAPSGTVVISNSQSGGRGRSGKTFFSPAGTGIYMSLVLRPEMDAVDSRRLTTYTAVVVSRAIENCCAADIKIKWVNDLFLNRRKICGILTEAGVDFESGQLDYVVIGIGINVHRCIFPDELTDISTSIENECQHQLSRNKLIGQILNEFSFSECFKSTEYMAEYRKRSNIIGTQAKVNNGNACYTGTVIEIADDAALLIQTEQGIRRVDSGIVTFAF